MVVSFVDIFSQDIYCNLVKNSSSARKEGVSSKVDSTIKSSKITKSNYSHKTGKLDE